MNKTFNLTNDFFPDVSSIDISKFTLEEIEQMINIIGLIDIHSVTSLKEYSDNGNVGWMYVREDGNFIISNKTSIIKCILNMIFKVYCFNPDKSMLHCHSFNLTNFRQRLIDWVEYMDGDDGVIRYTEKEYHAVESLLIALRTENRNSVCRSELIELIINTILKHSYIRASNYTARDKRDIASTLRSLYNLSESDIRGIIEIREIY